MNEKSKFYELNKLTARHLFNNFYVQTQKKLGQNFIFDEKIIKKIVSAAGDLKDLIVMEVGPGPGGLTLEILKHPIKKLYIIEFDSRWVEIWQNLMPLFDDKLEVIYCDALNFDELSISPQVIISNLPYNISTQLLTKWLPNFDRFKELILMFQKEVGDRLYAKPSTKNYGRLSVLCQWKAKVEKILDLESGSFYPPPKIKSTVVKFTPHEKDELFQHYPLFSKLVEAAFLHRRKTVIKSWKKYSQDIESILLNLGYNNRVRGEEIHVEDFQKIVKEIIKQKGM